MKPALLVLFTFCLIFSACNNTPKESQQATTTKDSSNTSANDLYPDSLIMDEPITSSAKHYFSDSSGMDSFAAEMPAGNIVVNFCSVKIYNSAGNLLFQDSIYSNALCTGDDKGDKTETIKDLKRGVAALFDKNNFDVSGQLDAIKNASADQIKNMVAWNEAIEDTNRIVFSYFKGEATAHACYSQKLKKAVVAVQVYSDGED